MKIEWESATGIDFRMLKIGSTETIDQLEF